MFLVCFFIIWGQQEELGDRTQALNDLKSVNQCGDKYTQIPDSFIEDVNVASDHIRYSIVGAIIQTIAAFATCIACVASGESKTPGDYEKVPSEEH